MFDSPASPPPRDSAKGWLGQIAAWALSFTVFEQIGPTVVLAAMLKELGASPMLIGIMVALTPIGMATQAIGAPLLESLRSRKKTLIVLTILSSLPYLMMAAGVWWLAPTSKGWTIGAVAIGLALVALICGLREVTFFEFAGATISRPRRGRFFGLRDAVTAGTGALAGAAVYWTLSRYAGRFPLGYVAILVAGFAAVTAAWLALLLTDDRPRPAGVRPEHPLHLFKSLPAMLRQDRCLARYLLWRTLLQASRSAHAFLVVFALVRFSLGDRATGLFILAA